MPWADDVAAIVQAWFPGEEWGNALADVLSGDVSPSGKLPTTIPVRIEDTPAFTNYPGERGQVRYGEGVFVGYRWYDTRRIEPRFCFGHGLSYTTFELGAPTWDGEAVHVRVTNTGAVRGAETVQCYVHDIEASVARPQQELKAFAKVWLDPGESRDRRPSRSTSGRSRSGTSPRTRGRPNRARSSCASARRRARSRTG